MKKKRRHHLQNTGAYAGGRYGDFRYGENFKNQNGTVRQVYMPGQTQRPLTLNKDKRAHVVAEVTAQLKDWTSTPFQFEGAIRAGLRSGLCLDGNDWERSDATAAELVAEGLKNIGAQRPSWEEGQWSYAIAREDCARCGHPIDDEGQASGHRYCSAGCAQAAANSLQAVELRRDNKLIRNAQRVVRDHKTPVLECSHCKTTYRDAGKSMPSYMARGIKHQYCSKACFNASKKVLEDRECKWCSKTFSPQASIHEHCSKACAIKTAHRVRWAKVAEQPEKPCAVCSTPFRPKQDDSLYCSRRCAHKVYNRQYRKRQAAAVSEVAMLTAAMFDEWVTAPVRLTPERFDQLVAA